MRTLVPMAIAPSTPFNLVTVAEDFGATLAQLGRDRDAASLLGAADATAAEMGNARREAQANEIGPAYELARSRLGGDEWDHAYALGGSTPIDELLKRMVSDV
jgi:hypothetical protein